MMTWKPEPTPDDVCFETIKTALESVPAGVKMVINSGEFYGITPRTANLELIARFFDKYPELADKAFLSVKGGTKVEVLEPDSSPENLRRSVDCILEKLRGTKKLDLFECARVDRKVPVEEAIKTLSGFVAEGKFDFIGMSEVSAATLRKGHSVHPIAAVEIEVSPWSHDDKIKEVITTAKELGIAVCAYSPLGRGFLTGQKPEDFQVGDFRRNLARFRAENVEQNLKFVNALKSLAEKKGLSPAQLCIAWVSSLGPHIIPLQGSSNKERTLENLSGGEVVLSAQDQADIKELMESHTIAGGRSYGDDHAAHLMI